MLAGNTAERARLIWGPSGTKYQPFKEAPYKDDFDEWLARVVCYAFSLPPTAFTRQLNRATAETAQAAALSEGLAPLMGWVKRWLTTDKRIRKVSHRKMTRNGAMTERMTALRNLAVGDMFHSRSPNRASLICLVTSVTDDTIYARRITTQDDHRFDRQTGMSLDDDHSRIDCAAPFPPDLYNVFLELDRKGQVHAAMLRNGIKPDLDRYRLTPEEKRALLVIDDHIAANPI